DPLVTGVETCARPILAVTLDTVVKDFMSKKEVPGAMVTMFDNVNFMSPFDTKTADTLGYANFTIPTGHKRFGFKMTGDMVMPTLDRRSVAEGKGGRRV